MNLKLTNHIKINIHFNFVDGELELNTQKITEKKIFIEDQLDIKTNFEGIGNEINQIDITDDDLHEIVNWLFLHKKFIYNL